MFHKILIANRGEIAVRIIRACKEMGIETVAVYSKADKDSLHVRLASEAICIGGAQSSESYLNIPSIISAAEVTDVEAIHPGYGFLAENAHFSEICESCGIKFIGPRPESVRLMGDKNLARQTVDKAGVAITPGSKILKSPEEALKFAKKIGYPVIVKAKAGGGGKGMRTAHNDGSLVSAFSTAKAEAEASFSNGDLYMEKYITEPRHIEIQVLADSKGNVVHLGERDCSIQRRHQKLIEEAPSPALSKKTRKKLGEAAVKITKAVKYENAGTIEFLVDNNENYYFMEMNTRLQVEHPVTEMMTGIDLVKEQIRIAAGEKLGYTQADIEIKGAAIECRINAEDPDNNFMPCPGKITDYLPPGGPHVRVDSHVYNGYDIPPFYDSMIGKVIVHAEHRHEAVQRMIRALSEMVVDPIKTTIPLQLKILQRPLFQKGDINTGFLEKLLNQSITTENLEAKPKKKK